MAKLIEMEGIGHAIADKLRQAGVTSVNGLLKAAANRKGRQQVAEKSGLDESKLLRFVNMADLYRIKGVGSEYAELLEAAGIDTVKELRNRNAQNLYTKIQAVNASQKLVRQLPSLKKVQQFIDQAKELTPLVTY